MHCPLTGTQFERNTHRGMPRLSGRQHFSGLLLQVPELISGGSQQLFATLHANEIVASLQISPGFEQELALPQRPNLSPGFILLQRRPWGSGDPKKPYSQQSASVWQSSPSGAQPDGCSQILRPPAAPLVPHDREQQA